VAFTVTFACPVAAELAAVNVARNHPELASAPNPAVTPAGRPDAASVMLPANPFRGAIKTAAAPFPPWTTLRFAGARLIPKSGGGATVTVIGTLALRLPDVPVTVNCEDFKAAVAVAASVSVVDEAVLAGLNEADTPVGNPDAASATVPVNPFCGCTLIETVPLPPAITFRAEAAAESLNPAEAVIVSGTVALAEMLPDVAVTVAIAVPAGAEAATVKVSLLVELITAGLNAAVTPLGSPLIARLAVPLNPFNGVSVTVVLPVVPWVMLTLDGAAARVKLGTATVSESFREVVRLPATVVTVTVAVPAAAEDIAVNVSVLVVAAGDGPNDAVTPAGIPVALNVTFPLKPLFGVIVIVDVACEPACSVKLPGAAESVNDGSGNPPSALISGCPAGVPHPVARSYPAKAL
jgi:hypothetical protein